MRLVAALHAISRKQGESHNEKTISFTPVREGAFTLQKTFEFLLAFLKNHSRGVFFLFRFSKCLPLVAKRLETEHQNVRKLDDFYLQCKCSIYLMGLTINYNSKFQMIF